VTYEEIGAAAMLVYYATNIFIGCALAWRSAMKGDGPLIITGLFLLGVVAGTLLFGMMLVTEAFERHRKAGEDSQ
jgi:hypothetical protein